ncbi:MAG TPA: hypothetical protein VFH88_09745 [Candidatus Krumholzibacteria bacterium]|nr:hypothetical protein [Candidatus Krumholzibacteria bacterium]
MNRKLWALSIVMACALVGLTFQADAPHTTASSPLVTPSPAGMTVNIDPTTGAIVPEAVPGGTKLEIPAQLANSWSTNDDGLVEEPNPSGHKGVYVNLQGRYASGMVGTVTTDGALATPCAQGLNTAADQSASRK